MIDKSTDGKRRAAYLKEEISQGLNRLGLIRLAVLLKDNSISHTRLRVSKIINRALKDIHNGYRSVLIIKRHKHVPVVPVSREGLFKTFSSSGNSVFEVAILLSLLKGKNIKKFLTRAEEFLKIKNKILLNGDDVQRILNIKQGTKVGKILSALKDQQFKGSVKTKAEARRWLMLNYT